MVHCAIRAGHYSPEGRDQKLEGVSGFSKTLGGKKIQNNLSLEVKQASTFMSAAVIKHSNS